MTNETGTVPHFQLSAANSSLVSNLTSHDASASIMSSTMKVDDGAPYLNDVMGDTTLRVLFITMYGVIFVLGISGNSLVAFVVLRNPAMQTITNVFITNLAVSDILMCLLAVPFTPLSGLLKSWVFGEALCHLVPMILGVTVHVSTLTSTAIAVDRYLVIVHPFRSRMKTPLCIGLIGAIWLLAISVSLPLGVYMKVEWLDAQGITICQEHWPFNLARNFFTVSNFTLQYIVPCGVITYCYTKVSCALGMRARLKIGTGRSINRERHALEIYRKRRTNRMLIAMVVISVVCWLPLNVIHMTLEFYEELAEWRGFLLTFFIAHVIAMSSTIYNPFLYAWMNENFQAEFRQILPCTRYRGRGPMRKQQISRASVSALYSVVETPMQMNGRNMIPEALIRVCQARGHLTVGVCCKPTTHVPREQTEMQPVVRSEPINDVIDDVVSSRQAVTL